VKPLPIDEQNECAVKAQAGDVAARNRLVVATMGLVWVIAKYYGKRNRSPRVDIEDLVQAGVTGTIRAIETFDATRGASFATYASNWIRARIASEVGRNQHHTNVPSSVYYAFRKACRLESERIAEGWDRGPARRWAQASVQRSAQVSD
jgi:RNA polymerase sigma factor (sigma-70 family)